MSFLFSFFKKCARFAGYDVEITNIHRPNPLRLWETDPEFRTIRNLVEKNTSMNEQVMFMLYQFAKAAPREGDFAEVGVFKGGSSYMLATVAPNRTIHSFDTFEGMPETDPTHDWHKKGDFMVDSFAILSFLAQKENIQAHKGFFPDTAEPVLNTKFSLAHIDVDIYKSIKDCLEFFYPRMVPGGFIISDDYGAITCPGAKEAWDAFFADKPEKSIYLPTRQCVVIKH